MNKEFLELLIEPETGSPFRYNKKKNILVSVHSGAEYLIKSGIPVIKKNSEKEGLEKAMIHSEHSSEFRYNSHYERDAEAFDYFKEFDSRASRHENRRLHEQIFSLIKGGEGVVLDVGCGNGWVSRAANKQGLKVISMDISTRNPVEVIKNNPGDGHFGLVADVYNLPVKDKSMDYIIASEVMEHVTDPGMFIEILYSKLKEKGKLIITTPYNEKIIYHLCVHCNRLTPEHAHLHSFNENNIKDLLPPDCKWTWIKFSNKYMAKLRTHVLFQYLPFSLWRIIDKLANFFLKAPSRLLVEIQS